MIDSTNNGGKRNFGLAIRSSFMDGHAPISGDWSNNCDVWERVVAHDGSDVGRLVITSERLQSIRNTSQVGNVSYLGNLFNQLILSDIQEETGGQIAYRGMCHKVTFSSGTHAFTIDITKMANEVNVKYESTETGWITMTGTELLRATESRKRYGKKRLRLSKENIESHLDAVEAGNRYLAMYSYPIMRPLSADDRLQLEVEYIGYQYVLTWLEPDAKIDVTGLTCKEALEKVIDQFNSEFGVNRNGKNIITYIPTDANNQGSIQDNGRVLADDYSGTYRSIIDGITDKLGADGSAWRWWIDTDNVFRFEPMDRDPLYFRRHGIGDELGIFYGRSGQRMVNPRVIEAGKILRDLTMPFQYPIPYSQLKQINDLYIESIKVDQDDKFDIQQLDSDEADLWSAVSTSRSGNTGGAVRDELRGLQRN